MPARHSSFVDRAVRTDATSRSAACHLATASACRSSYMCNDNVGNGCADEVERLSDDAGGVPRGDSLGGASASSDSLLSSPLPLPPPPPPLLPSASSSNASINLANWSGLSNPLTPNVGNGAAPGRGPLRRGESVPAAASRRRRHCRSPGPSATTTSVACHDAALKSRRRLDEARAGVGATGTGVHTQPPPPPPPPLDRGLGVAAPLLRRALAPSLMADQEEEEEADTPLPRAKVRKEVADEAERGVVPDEAGVCVGTGDGVRTRWDSESEERGAAAEATGGASVGVGGARSARRKSSGAATHSDAAACWSSSSELAVVWATSEATPATTDDVDARLGARGVVGVVDDAPA
mmetsp:Transcript_11877/g.37747  ORF Transcript_11877/g.37747 Transcript_11877/m.37747 type:complete len:351 (-) Transcript_11877:1154-2206(-)